MAKTKKEEKEVLESQGRGFTLDTEAIKEERKETVIPAAQLKEKVDEPKNDAPQQPAARRELVNCLQNKKIIVRHIPKTTGLVTDPKHVLFGGMARDAIRMFSVPRLSSGMFVDVFTKAEKDYLEHVMGLEPNQLSIYRKINNFWDDSTEGSISQVTLYKGDNYLDLSNPEDYIRYKILLANKHAICPSLKELQDRPLASYQFVIIDEGEDVKVAKANMNSIQQSYMEYGKISEDFDTLRVVVEILSGRPIAPSTQIDWLQTEVNKYIQSNSRLFLNIVTDKLLSTKVLIKKAVEAGILAYRGDQLFVREDNTPLCEYNEESTLGNAAKYLASPKHQDLLFAIQAKLKK